MITQAPGLQNRDAAASGFNRKMEIGKPYGGGRAWPAGVLIWGRKLYRYQRINLTVAH
jgi:hypothetical protein